MAKRVCIIGAGPAGIAAAKTLIHDHPGKFHVTVFEQSGRVGGLWPVSKQDDGMVNPDMCTNQSRHTVSFSDLAWPATTPAFPKAWQVGQYLERYIKTYPGYEIHTNSMVIRAIITDYGKWRVHVRYLKTSSEAQEDYDHVIITSGFFSKPKQIPDMLQKSGRVSHSSKYRNLNDLLKGSSPAKTDRNIVVVGGQMSGPEVAASIALHISSDANSPGEKKKNMPSYAVTHVIQRPFWVMPLLLPNDPAVETSGSVETAAKKNNPAPTFLPLDLVSYNLEARPKGELSNTSGHITEAIAGATHTFMEQHLGSDQGYLGQEFTITGGVRKHPPILGISDSYTEFVRSGDIKVIKGRVTRQPDGQDSSVIVEDGKRQTVINDVAAIVLATGFEVSPSLGFLSEDLLQTLQFDTSGDEFPLALNVHSVISRKLPSLGFVGFYRSPYWSVIQMQARYLGKLWTGDSNAAKALEEDKTMDTMLALRGDPRRAQFPMGDYSWLMEDFSKILGIVRFEPKDPSARTGQVSPNRYTYAKETGTTERHENELARSLFYMTFEKSKGGVFVAWAVCRSLQGNWKLERSITSHNDSYPSGTLSGTAKFVPRLPTGDDGPCDVEYLYLEQGDLSTETGMNFTAKRSYVYRYSQATDKLTAWFVKEDTSVDYFFHELEFSKGKGDTGWYATSKHWCSPDQYEVEYEFRFKGTNLTEWSQTYQVKGPNKDYTLRSRFLR
ncbi:flavin-containing monooxygenase-like protein [Calycina marina]|uniref:Flavin-containing monooxygenase-like protein n=1 Tax=Calycina marina TaxID=1763456 RepID=A0A9P8CHN4_9HELO|nr:flavin-containing monooxygenase-like protein [Calycina marina]